jgi:glucosamine 6-phosphate synthetase-like amidotransferase/phosphosugar isomerase protein
MAAQQYQSETLEANITRLEAEKREALADVKGFKKQCLALTLIVATIEKERDSMKKEQEQVIHVVNKICKAWEKSLNLPA